MPFNPFSQLTSKIFGGLLLLSLVTLGPGLWLTRAKLADARETITSLETWQSEMVASIALAADNPALDASTAKAQVQALGTARIELTNAVKNQNAAILEIERQTAEAIAIARQAEIERRAAVQRIELLQADLRRRAAAPVPPAELELEVRRSQDQLYEAGI